MAQEVEPSQLTGLFKQVYGDDLINLIPENAELTKKIPFKAEDGPGDYFQQPVIVQREHGFTYAGATEGAFSLNDYISMKTQNAKVQGAMVLLRSAISYDAASKSSTSKKAFKKGTELLLKNMMESMTHRIEVACMYGRSGLATIASSANAASTSTVLTLGTGTMAAGIWSGMEGAEINVYQSTSLVGTAYTITAINIEDRTLTISGASSDITSLDTKAGTVATMTVWFNGSYGKEMYGMDSIISNTATLFNIDAASYQLWKAQSQACGSAALTMAKILSGVNKAVNRGLKENVDCWINPLTWANLASDLAALRTLDSSYNAKLVENGSESIKFHGQNGIINIVPYSMVKEGEGFIIPTKRWKRIGSQDISFKTPGRGSDIFLHLASNAGFELRLFTDQQIFCETPAKCVKLTGITNS